MRLIKKYQVLYQSTVSDGNKITLEALTRLPKDSSQQRPSTFPSFDTEEEALNYILETGTEHDSYLILPTIYLDK